MGRLGDFALRKVESVVEKSKEQTEKATADLKESFCQIIDGQNDQTKALLTIFELVDQNNDMVREVCKVLCLAAPKKPKPYTSMTWEGCDDGRKD